ncbi:MAG: YcgN family cysteine cluster protein [Pseudomonadota bacterium]
MKNTPGSRTIRGNAAANSPYWETKSLEQMNDSEWEGLCDGCGRCCLVLLIDDDTDEIHETDVACRLYDPQTRRCGDYKNRASRVPDCVTLSPQTVRTLSWMPPTCAYRRLAEGQGLPSWHPLLTGTRDSVVRAGIATSTSLLNEDDIRDQDLPGRVRALRK